MEPNIGQRLRAIREQQGYSLRTLAQSCGLSFNAISRIERGESSPTVATLHVLAQALHVPITAFFEEATQQKVVLVRRDARLTAKSNGVTMASLGTGLCDQQMVPFMVTIEPGLKACGQSITHAGEEFVVCLHGHLCYEVDGEMFQLGAGDSLLFDATLPHSFGNISDQPAQFVLVYHTKEARHASDHHLLEG